MALKKSFSSCLPKVILNLNISNYDFKALVLTLNTLLLADTFHHLGFIQSLVF